MKTRNLFIATILIFIAIIITQNSTFLIGFEFQSLLTVMFQAVVLFSDTLSAILTLPELALFAGTALLLTAVGIFSWIIRRSKRP